MGELYSLKAKEILAYIKSEGILFWLVNIYLFLEYVRPQTLYPTLDVLPYGKIVLLITLVVLILKKNDQFIKHLGNKLFGLFFLVVFMSSVLALSPVTAFDKIFDLVAWMMIYFLIINIVNTEKRFLIFILAFLLYSFKMSQHSFIGWITQGFGFSDWGTGGGPGWFHNSGEFGIQMCVFLSIATYFFVALKDHWPRWKKFFFLLFPFTALTGTISGSSRGALLGAGAVLFWMLLKSRHKIKGIVVLTLVAALVFAFLPQKQVERFKQAGKDKTSIQRLERWEKGIKMVSRYPVFGVGYANWGVADRNMFGEDGGLSHNIFIECMSELGYTGLTVFVLMIVFTFFSNHQTRKFASQPCAENQFMFWMAHGLDGALVGYLVGGYFVTVLYYPYFWINLAMTVALNSVARKYSDECHAV